MRIFIPGACGSNSVTYEFFALTIGTVNVKLVESACPRSFFEHTLINSISFVLKFALSNSISNGNNFWIFLIAVQFYILVSFWRLIFFFLNKYPFDKKHLWKQTIIKTNLYFLISSGINGGFIEMFFTFRYKLFCNFLNYYSSITS